MSGIWKLIGWLLSVSGILVQSGPPQIRVVTAIQVEATVEDRQETYLVTDPELMHDLMNYLRQLDPYTTAEINEETFRAYSTYLTVEYSDGDQTHYHQLYTDYLKIDGGPWKTIDPEDGARLWGILACISQSDSI